MRYLDSSKLVSLTYEDEHVKVRIDGDGHDMETVIDSLVIPCLKAAGFGEATIALYIASVTLPPVKEDSK